MSSRLPNWGGTEQNLSLQGPGSACTKKTCVHVQAALVPACPLRSQLKHILGGPGMTWDDQRGSFGVILGSFWGHLGCHFGVILGSFSALGPQTWLWSFREPFMCLLGLPFGCHFGDIFGSFSSLKIRAVFVPLRGPILGSILGSFWCYFQTRQEDLFFTCF